MKKNVLKYAAAVFSAVLLTGCPGKETLPEHMSGTVAVDLNVSGMDMRSGDIQADGSAIRDVLAYRFSEGEFREKLLPVSSEGSLFVFNPEVREGRLYILANASSVEAVLDRLPTAEIVGERDGTYEIRAEVFGKGIDMWMKSQGAFVEIL